MFLLTTLFILEIAIEEMTIQRRTIILPLKAFPALERRSLSGLGTAASCILSLQTALLSIYVPAFAPRNYLFEFIVAGFCILLAALALLIYTILIAKGKISTCESSYRLYSLPSG